MNIANSPLMCCKSLSILKYFLYFYNKLIQSHSIQFSLMHLQIHKSLSAHCSNVQFGFVSFCATNYSIWNPLIRIQYLAQTILWLFIFLTFLIQPNAREKIYKIILMKCERRVKWVCNGSYFLAEKTLTVRVQVMILRCFSVSKQYKISCFDVSSFVSTRKHKKNRAYLSNCLTLL